ncbi:F-box/LRR-repeat protein 25 [Linum grandiflorum]
MNNCCVYHLRNAAKRAREDAAKRARSADRLSSLPDSILHHILSFLDIKCVVQTSVLSRMWRCVWKHTPVLYFHRDSDCDISDSFGSTMSFDLKTLELACAAFPSGFGSSSFQMLTTLCLIKCHLRHDEEGVFDLISSFPSLIHLVISECIWVREKLSSYSKIIGPQLLRLELDKVLDNTEIVAPRLEFFDLEFAVSYPYVQGFSKLSLPSLVHADVLVPESCLLKFRNVKGMDYYFDNLFQGLRNAISLVIRSESYEVEFRHLNNFLS